MGRLDVSHGGFGCEAEDAHEVDGVSGVRGFVQDPVLAQLGGAEAQLLEDGVDDGECYRGGSGVVGGLRGCQQVGVDGEGPAPAPFAEAGDRVGVGEVVEVDAVLPGAPPDDEAAGGQVEVLGEQQGGFFLAERVDGDQRDDQLAHRAVRPVDQPAELVSGDRDGQPPHRRQRDPAGRVPEDDPFLPECPEQAAQGGKQVARRDGRPGVERCLDVVAGDLAQAGDLPGPGREHGVEAVEVAADRRVWQFPVLAAAFAAYYLDPLAEFGGDRGGEGLDALLDCALDGGALAGGVGDDHAVFCEELQDPPDGGAGPVAECPDVGFVDRSGGSCPRQQDPQGLASVIA